VSTTLAEDRAIDDVRTYFQPGPDDVRYTGRHFEAIGNIRSSPDRVTAEDLVAVQMLGVTIPPEVSVSLVQGDLGPELAHQLAQISTELTIRDPEARLVLSDGGPALRAWNLLTAQHGIAATKASKLLARKRPALLPIWDDVVACWLGRPTNFWMGMQASLIDERITDRLAQIRRAGNISDRVTDLRVVDVALWMRHQADHRRHACAPTGVAAER
jgi:hypothetical protein